MDGVRGMEQGSTRHATRIVQVGVHPPPVFLLFCRRSLSESTQARFDMCAASVRHGSSFYDLRVVVVVVVVVLFALCSRPD